MTDSPAWGHDPAWPIDDPTDEIDDSKHQENTQPPESAGRANSHTGPTPPRLFFANLDEFVRDFVRLVFRGNPPKPSSASKPCGDPGNKPASTPPPASAPGSVTTPTTT